MTLTQTIQVCIVASILCALIFVVMAKLAKPGWQDDRGFHEGDEHADDDNLGI